MKIDDVVFELEANYVNEEHISQIVSFIKEKGFKAEVIDDMLVDFGYDPIFDELDQYGFDPVEKIQHKKTLKD
ncbi:MAG: hypothetical protein JXQ68_04825 [Campylobacterales bacterium]|nr:hypothetical protein [Campylobacterales bacterium]